MGFELKDKVVFITGASSGIGRACAIEYHRAGSLVVAAARSADKLRALAHELGSSRIAPVAVDVTVPAQREAALAEARDRFGPVDVLVNNAGWASFASVLRTPAEHVDRMLQLNLAAPIAMIQAVLPSMLERGSGQIVNISSVVGNQAIARMAVYSATKAALSSLSTGLRMELKGTGVDVVLVSPGSTNTAFFEVAGNVDVEAHRVARRQHTPERVARAVVYASRHRRREVTLTVEGKIITVIRRISHRLADSITSQVARRSMRAT
ncbi:MAG: SDR family NAD(P)-dependent oxidoreductase [Phycisphaerae bacterium]